MKRIIILVAVILLVVTGCKTSDKYKEAVDLNDETTKVVTIKRGSTTSSIAKVLTNLEIIHNESIFKKVVKDSGYDGKLKAGDYEFSKSYPLKKIVEKLYNGDTYVETVKFTIQEGLELDEIIQKLIDEKVITDKDDFMNTLKEEVSKYEIIKDLDLVSYEGFLFPDTYIVKKGASNKMIVDIMLNRFTKVFDEELINYIEENNLDLYKILTLASIIEREVMIDEEREIASSVFYNRLDINMKLQSCATVQYVIDERKTNLSNKDISIENEYNTYKYKGLPPGPICSPGEASIRAAVYPADTDYLYFVRSYKDDNSHIFSTNLKDHNKAKRKLYEGE